MDPLAPRFLSMDPAAVDGTASNFNRYAYAGNTPYRKFDPDGRDPVFVSSYAYQQSAVLEQINDRIESVGIDLGRQAVGFAPGGEVALCAAGGCGVGGWAAAVLAAVPGEGKIAELGIKATGKIGKVLKDSKRFYSKKERQEILDRARDVDGVAKCEYCGQRLNEQKGTPNSYEADHVTPHSKGGMTSKENSAAACRTCNRSKGDKELGSEWTPPPTQNERK